jgi:hypothetical protein
MGGDEAKSPTEICAARATPKARPARHALDQYEILARFLAEPKTIVTQPDCSNGIRWQTRHIQLVVLGWIITANAANIVALGETDDLPRVRSLLWVASLKSGEPLGRMRFQKYSHKRYPIKMGLQPLRFIWRATTIKQAADEKMGGGPMRCNPLCVPKT